MHIITLRICRNLALLLLFLQQVKAVPVQDTGQTTCRDPIVRKEWRGLSNNEKLQYLGAVQCILKKPAITPKSVAPGAVSRYDDLVATHISQMHFVGHFLPFHRLFTAYYERILRQECGYQGAQPYWNWVLDTPAPKFASSPIFDAVYGFGGNGPYIPGNSSMEQVPGRTGGGCVVNGPFKNMTVRLGPMNSLANNPRCLRRDLAPYFAGRFLAWNQTKLTLDQPDFGWFHKLFEGGGTWAENGIHGGGHHGIGGTYGQMADPMASPADPIFYMMHANLDRVWWTWQMKDPATRLREISGPMFMKDWKNERGGNTTLDYPLSLGYNGVNVTVGATMDIKSGPLCYDYDALYE